jgi:hypothetical protein
MASQPQIRFCLKVRFREFRELREFSQGITARRPAEAASSQRACSWGSHGSATPHPDCSPRPDRHRPVRPPVLTTPQQPRYVVAQRPRLRAVGARRG